MPASCGHLVLIFTGKGAKTQRKPVYASSRLRENTKKKGGGVISPQRKNVYGNRIEGVPVETGCLSACCVAAGRSPASTVALALSMAS